MSNETGHVSFGSENLGFWSGRRVCVWAHSHSVTDSDRNGGVWQRARSSDNDLNSVSIFGLFRRAPPKYSFTGKIKDGEVGFEFVFILAYKTALCYSNLIYVK